jgi:hypothetical protein
MEQRSTLATANQSWGRAPVRLKYKPTDTFRAGKECMSLETVHVRWLSGADASISSLSVCPQQGSEQQFTFMRPQGVDGGEIDAKFAYDIALVNAIAASVAPPPPPAAPPLTVVAPPRVVSCTSNIIGSFIYTNCR